MLDLHYWTTPNGHKITMFLEETGLPYRIVPVNIGKGEQFRAEFLRSFSDQVQLHIGILRRHCNESMDEKIHTLVWRNLSHIKDIAPFQQLTG